MSWYELKGTIKTVAGVNGTVTFTPGARILQIIVTGQAGAAMTIPDGTSVGHTVNVPMPSNTPWIYNATHASRIMQGPANTAAVQIVFNSSVTSYFVEYIDPAGVS